MDELKDFRADLPVADATRMSKAKAALELGMEEEASGDSRTHRTRGSSGLWVRRWIPAGTLAVACAATAIALIDGPSRESVRDDTSAATEHLSETTPIQYGEALLRFPNETAEDVVSRADQVAVVTAVKSAPVPDVGDKAQQAAGEGLILRKMVFRVDRTLWTPGDGLPPVAGTFTALVNGWVMHNFKETRFAIDGTAWPEDGAQYIAPISVEGGEPKLELPAAVFPLTDSEVAPAPTQDTPLARALAGDSLPQAADTFRAAEAHLVSGSK